MLSYWFGDEPWSQQQKWFAGGTAVDEEIRERFGATIEAALAGDLDVWTDSLEGVLALVVVLDQFTRNVFRGSPRCFAGDEAAQALALATLDSEGVGSWQSQHRMFLLMPLMHAEAKDLQRRALFEFGTLWQDDPETAGVLDAAAEHAAIVLRFGRFPDRNRLMGREPTKEESDFLQHESRPWFET